MGTWLQKSFVLRYFILIWYDYAVYILDSKVWVLDSDQKKEQIVFCFEDSWRCFVYILTKHLFKTGLFYFDEGVFDNLYIILENKTKISQMWNIM